MEFFLRFLIFYLLLLLAGCETTKLWTGNPGEDFIKVVPTNPNEDVEAALKQSGREYYCQDLYASTHANNKVCYIELTTDDKIKQIKVKLLKTPLTLAIDAGHTIKVVGSVTLYVIINSGYTKG
jgi:hypothetical protein